MSRRSTTPIGLGKEDEEAELRGSVRRRRDYEEERDMMERLDVEDNGEDEDQGEETEKEDSEEEDNEEEEDMYEVEGTSERGSEEGEHEGRTEQLDEGERTDEDLEEDATPPSPAHSRTSDSLWDDLESRYGTLMQDIEDIQRRLGRVSVC
jgi:hypothetical protein